MKVAISLPDPVFDAAERLAEELHVTRSKLYADAIAQYLETHGGSAVTAKLNAVYSRQSAALGWEYSLAQSASIHDEAW
jgi:predicted transcriptional regulator